jgi:hypothetical protein
MEVRMRRMNGRIATAASALLAVAGTCPAAAEGPARTMAAVGQRLAPGTQVEVVDRAGQVVQGRFRRADGEGIAIDLDGLEEWRVPAADVLRVDTVGDSLRNGILIGLASGALVGVAAATVPEAERVSCVDGQCTPWCVEDSCRWALAAAVTASGAAVGAYLDHRRTGRRTVFRSPVRRLASVSVAPQLVRRGVGAKVAVRF